MSSPAEIRGDSRGEARGSKVEGRVVERGLAISGGKR
jgi:hypothetical protein